METLNAEIEAIRIFMNDQFCLLKNSGSKQNISVLTENMKVSSIVYEVIATVFFVYKTYFKPKIHKTVNI